MGPVTPSLNCPEILGTHMQQAAQQSSLNDSIMLELDEIACGYSAQPVISRLSMRVRRGSVVCLLGPSGCGKTTVLRAIAGFQPLSSGRIRLRGETVSEPGLTVPPERRRIGMVFQDYALFPHLNIIENVVFGLTGFGRRARLRRGRQMLELVGLEGSPERYPHQLSGGQQQRVALARALAAEPELVLLDEPFSSLDVDLRERLSHEVHDILKAQGTTAVMVTHDQNEAFAMGESVGVMRAGRLRQWDTPYNLYHDPADRFVADFIGQGRFVPATLRSPDTLETPVGVIHADRAFLWPPGTDIELLLRPDDIVPDESASLRGQVVKKAFKGAETLYSLRFDNGVELLSLFPSHLDFPVGEIVGVRIAANHAVAFEVSN